MICRQEGDKPCQKCSRMRHTWFTSNRPQKLTNKLWEEKEGKAEKGVGQPHRAERSNNLFCILFYFHFECTADIRTEAFVELVNVSHPK